METAFSPLQSLGGGILIGLSATLLMATLGRVMGATGILTGALWPDHRGDRAWRIALILGMLSGPTFFFWLSGEPVRVQVPITMPMLIIGGFIVGLGVTFGSGCTSGHGVCGLARFSPRSLVATVTFMVTAIITVFIIRHIIG